MVTISQLTEFLGWVAIINLAYLLIATLLIMFKRDFLISIHGKFFGIADESLVSKYFDFLSYYKIVTLVFVVAPYIALKIMAY